MKLKKNNYNTMFDAQECVQQKRLFDRKKVTRISKEPERTQFHRKNVVWFSKSKVLTTLCNQNYAVISIDPNKLI